MMKHRRHIAVIIIAWGLMNLVPMSYAQTPIPTLPAPPAGVDFVWWQDPLEGAFAMQIPSGWQTMGGMLDIFGLKRANVNVISPDNRTAITIGTNTIELVIVPSPELEAQGYVDGHVFIHETGLLVAISPFRSGAKAAQLMADSYIKPNCQNYEMTNTYDYERQETETTLISAGEAQFKCTINNVTYSGYFYAVTIAEAIEGLGYVWTMDTFYGIFTLPNNIVIAAQVLQYMLQTTIYNPEWVALQQTQPNAPDMLLQTQVADDALLDATLSQIIGMSQQSLMETIASMDGTFEYEYEFLP